MSRVVIIAEAVKDALNAGESVGRATCCARNVRNSHIPLRTMGWQAYVNINACSHRHLAHVATVFA